MASCQVVMPFAREERAMTCRNRRERNEHCVISRAADPSGDQTETPDADANEHGLAANAFRDDDNPPRVWKR